MKKDQNLIKINQEYFIQFNFPTGVDLSLLVIVKKISCDERGIVTINVVPVE